MLHHSPLIRISKSQHGNTAITVFTKSRQEDHHQGNKAIIAIFRRTGSQQGNSAIAFIHHQIKSSYQGIQQGNIAIAFIVKSCQGITATDHCDHVFFHAPNGITGRQHSDHHNHTPDFVMKKNEIGNAHQLMGRFFCLLLISLFVLFVQTSQTCVLITHVHS